MERLVKILVRKRMNSIPDTADDLIRENGISWHISEAIAAFISEDYSERLPKGLMGKVKERARRAHALDMRVEETFKQYDICHTLQSAIKDITRDVFEYIEQEIGVERSLGTPHNNGTPHPLSDNNLRKIAEQYLKEPTNKITKNFIRLAKALELQEEQDEDDEYDPDNTDVTWHADSPKSTSQIDTYKSDPPWAAQEAATPIMHDEFFSAENRKTDGPITVFPEEQPAHPYRAEPAEMFETALEQRVKKEAPKKKSTLLGHTCIIAPEAPPLPSEAKSITRKEHPAPAEENLKIQPEPRSYISRAVNTLTRVALIAAVSIFVTPNTEATVTPPPEPIITENIQPATITVPVHQEMYCDGRVVFRRDTPSYRQFRQNQRDEMFDNPASYNELVRELTRCAADNGGEVYLAAYASETEMNMFRGSSRRLESFIRRRGQVLMEDIIREAERTNSRVRVMLDARGRTDAFPATEGNSTVVFSTRSYLPDLEAVTTTEQEVAYQLALEPGSVRTAGYTVTEQLTQEQYQDMIANRQAEPRGERPAPTIEEPQDIRDDVIASIVQRAGQIGERCRGSDSVECAEMRIAPADETVVATTDDLRGGDGDDEDYSELRREASRDRNEGAADDTDDAQPRYPPDIAQVVEAFDRLAEESRERRALTAEEAGDLALIREDDQYRPDAGVPEQPREVNPGGFVRTNPFGDSSAGFRRQNPFEDPDIPSDLPGDAGLGDISERIETLRQQYLTVSRQVDDVMGQASCTGLPGTVTQYYEAMEDIEYLSGSSGRGSRARRDAEQRTEAIARASRAAERLNAYSMTQCIREYRRVGNLVFRFETAASEMEEALSRMSGRDAEQPMGDVQRLVENASSLMGRMEMDRYTNEFLEAGNQFPVPGADPETTE